MAAYAEAGQCFTFYEIDPAVAQIAADRHLFTYLGDCRGRCEIVPGDARIELTRAPHSEFDAVILDAFSSDSIPAHLMTREALQLYTDKLKEDGILVFHISNRYLNLEPILARLAEDAGLVCHSRHDFELSEQEKRDGKLPSQYLVMTRHAGDLGKLAQNPNWSPVSPPAGTPLWTDDYSDVLSALRW